MRKAAFLTLGVFVAAPPLLLAQLPARPEDSIIIETKSVAPNLTGSPAFAVKVYITNKDSLYSITLTMETRTIAGTAYALLNRTADGRLLYGSVVTRLTNTLSSGPLARFNEYNDASPDSFLVYTRSNSVDLSSYEPPNAVRKPVLELKFRHSSDSVGQVLLDSSRILGQGNYFTTSSTGDVPVNFLPGILTVEYQKGDLNLSGGAVVTAADIVWGIKAVFGETPPAGRSASDLNCDGEVSSVDVVLLINAAFLQEAFPC